MTRARWLACLAGLALARSAVLAVVVPPYQSSDEPWHLDYARVVADGRLPVMGKTRLDPALVAHDKRVTAEHGLTLYGIDSPPMSREAFQPPVAYLLPAAAYRITRRPSSGLAWFRAIDVLAGAAAALVACRVARQAFPRSPYAGPTAALGTVCLPSFAAVTATANNDALSLAVAPLALGLAAGVARRGGRPRSLAALGALVGVAGLLKASNLLLAFPAAAAALVAPRRERGDRQLARSLVTLAIATAVVSGPWIVRNLAVYHDPFGTSAFEKFPVHPGRDIGGVRLLLGAAPRLRGADRFWPSLGRSAVGVLRWDDLRLPAWAYVVALAGAVAGAVAVVRWLRGPATAADRRVALVLLVALGAYLAGVVWYALTVDYQPQGRYLLPALVGVLALLGAALGRRGAALAAAVLLALLGAAVATAVATFGWP